MKRNDLETVNKGLEIYFDSHIDRDDSLRTKLFSLHLIAVRGLKNYNSVLGI